MLYKPHAWVPAHPRIVLDDDCSGLGILASLAQSALLRNCIDLRLLTAWLRLSFPSFRLFSFAP